MLCDLCFTLHKTLGEIGEEELDDLVLQAVYENEYAPQRQWDRRFAMVAAASLAAFGGKYDEAAFMPPVPAGLAALMGHPDESEEAHLRRLENYVRGSGGIVK